MSSIKITKIQKQYNTDDERFALVNWKGCEKYNVIPMKDFEKLDEYALEEEYKVKWNGQRYAAILKYIGTKTLCEEKEKEVTAYLVDKTLKGKVSNKPSARVLSLANKENSQLCEKEQLEAELKNVHQKLKEKESFISQLESNIESLNQTIKGLKEENSKMNSCISSAEKEKLIAIASCIFSNYATPKDVASLILKNQNNENDEVSISIKTPEQKMPSILKQSIITLSHQKVKTTKLYRNLLAGLVQNPLVFCNSNAEVLLKNPKIIAAGEFMREIRSDFSNIIENSTLTNICAEARRNAWDKDPSLEFKVNGTVYKKTTQKKKIAKDSATTEEGEESSEESISNSSKKPKTSSNDVLNSNQPSQIIPNITNAPQSAKQAINTASLMTNMTASHSSLSSEFSSLFHQAENQSFSETGFLIRESNSIIEDEDELTRPFLC